LIAAPADQSTGIRWHNGSFSGINTETTIGSGKSNTTKIIQKQGGGNYAAKLCDDLTLNGYSDWFLPSKDELNILYQNGLEIGGFDYTGVYWSSSEYGNYSSWYQYFYSGYQINYYKSAAYRVRAVRAF
jgi:hypothetical protein